MEGKEGIVGTGLSFGEKQVYYFPVTGFMTESYLLGQLERLFEAGNGVGTPDIKALRKKIKIEERKGIFDLSIGCYLLNPLKNSYTYDDAAKEYLGEQLPSQEEIFQNTRHVDLSQVSVEQAAEYASYQAYVSDAAQVPVKNALKDTGMLSLFEKIEMPLAFTLDDMEKEGILVKAEELKVYGEQLQVRIGELEKKIYEQAGETFNINSPKQLGVILFEKMGMPGGKKTKTGYSTAADVLDKLAPEYPFVADILEYRQLTKLKSTYADGLAAYI